MQKQPTVLKAIKGKQPFCHFSVDDCWQILLNPKGKAFKFLKSLYDEFGLVVTLYVFSKPLGKKFLHKIPAKTLSHYPWIRIGPHAPDWEHPLHTLRVKDQIKEIDYMYREITRIAGKKFFAEGATLHFYRGSKDVCERLAKLGVKVFFTQDFYHLRMSYYLPPHSREPLNDKGIYFDKENKLYFVKTSFCVEFRDNIIHDTVDYLKKYGFCKLYTHEKFLTDPVMQKRIKDVLRFCQKKKIPFVI